MDDNTRCPNHGSKTMEYSFAAMKKVFCTGRTPRLARKDLQERVQQARDLYFRKKNEWVKIDGAHKIGPTPVPVPVVSSSPAPKPLVWPVAISQEANRKCAYNSVRNIGYDVPVQFEIADLKTIIDHLVSNGVCQVFFLILFFFY